jgi:signal transduction histidine kinase/ligand-binding sensor domain-containing protein
MPAFLAGPTYRLWLLLLFWGSFGLLTAQAQPRPQRLFTTADGLPQSSVGQLTFDRLGQMWGSTTTGVFRYDGQQFHTYDYRHGLPDPFAYTATTGPDGRIWFGHQAAGISYYDPITDRIRRLRARALHLAEVRHICATAGPDGSSILWCLTLPDPTGVTRVVLGRRDTTVSVITAAELGVEASMLRDIEPGPTGLVLVAGHDGVSAIEIATGRARPSAVPAELRHVPCGRFTQISAREYWFATSKGIAHCTQPNASTAWRTRWYTTANGLTERQVLSVCKDRLGTLWANTPGGIARLENDRFVYLDAPAGVAAGELANTLVADPEGNVWAGLTSGLVEYFADARFAAYTPSTHALPSADVKSLAPDGAGGWYLGTTRNLARLRRGAKSRAETIPIPSGWRTPNVIQGLLLDSRGALWVCSFPDGFGRMDTTTHRFVEIPLPAEESVGSPTEDRRGRIWAGSVYDGRLYVVDPKTNHVRIINRPAPGTEGSNAVNSICRDARTGTLWVCTAAASLGRIDELRDTLLPAPGIPPGLNIVCAYPDDRASNHLWLSIESSVGGPMPGLYPYDGQRLGMRMPGIVHAPVTIRPAADGGLWLGTLRGLDHYNLRTGQLRSFGRTEGFSGGECNIDIAHTDAAGRLWLGTVGGLMVHDGTRAAVNRVAPHVLLTGMRVGVRDVAPNRSTVLRHDQNQVTFRYVGVSMSQPSQVRYRYRLRGLQTEWQPLTAQAEATFTNLSPGAYTFEVLAANNDGRWSKTPARYAFVIRPAWWNTWWARTLAVVVVAAALYWGYRLRVAQLLAVERLRVGIARDLHDDIGSTLSSISILSQLAEYDPAPAPALAQIGQHARQTLAAMDDIVWAINPAHDAPRDLTARIRAHAATLLEPVGLDFTLATEPPPLGLKLSMRVRREVFLIYKELLNNALKYAQARHLQIGLRYESHWLTLTVDDDGLGFHPTAPARGGGNGLANMRARAALLGGTLDLTTAPGQGTKWRLRIPL